jgi:hypothetical protein
MVKFQNIRKIQKVFSTFFQNILNYSNSLNHIIFKRFLYGISSFFNTDGLSCLPESNYFFAKITYYLDWIAKFAL